MNINEKIADFFINNESIFSFKCMLEISQSIKNFPNIKHGHLSIQILNDKSYPQLLKIYFQRKRKEELSHSFLFSNKIKIEQLQNLNDFLKNISDEDKQYLHSKYMCKSDFITLVEN